MKAVILLSVALVATTASCSYEQPPAGNEAARSSKDLPKAPLSDPTNGNRPQTPPTPPSNEPPTKASADEVSLHPGLQLVIWPVLNGPTGDREYIAIKGWQLGPSEIDFKMVAVRPGVATISEQERQSGRGFISPFFWGAGTKGPAPGPMIWLSQQTFAELHDSGQSTIAPCSMPNAMPGGGTGAPTPLALKKTGDGTHVISVAGRKIEVPVILAEDASGTQYKVLDTAADPLVVSLRYMAKSTVGGKPLDIHFNAGSGYDVVGIEPTPAPNTDKNPWEFDRMQRTNPAGQPPPGAH